MDWGLHLFDLLHEIHLNPSVNFIETDVLDICFLSVVGMGNCDHWGVRFYCRGFLEDCGFLGKKQRGDDFG